MAIKRALGAGHAAVSETVGCLHRCMRLLTAQPPKIGAKFHKVICEVLRPGAGTWCLVLEMAVASKAAALAGDGDQIRAIELLLSSFSEGQLERLELDFNPIGDDGASCIAAAPAIASLTPLWLVGAELGNTGAKALADSPYTKQITHLSAVYNNITADGLEIFCTPDALPALTHLNLNNDEDSESSFFSLEDSIRLHNARPGLITVLQDDDMSGVEYDQVWEDPIVCVERTPER